VTRGQLPQRAGSLGLNGGETAAALPPKTVADAAKVTINDQEVIYELSIDTRIDGFG